MRHRKHITNDRPKWQRSSQSPLHLRLQLHVLYKPIEFIQLSGFTLNKTQANYIQIPNKTSPHFLYDIYF